MVVMVMVVMVMVVMVIVVGWQNFEYTILYYKTPGYLSEIMKFQTHMLLTSFPILPPHLPMFTTTFSPGKRQE